MYILPNLPYSRGCSPMLATVLMGVSLILPRHSRQKAASLTLPLCTPPANQPRAHPAKRTRRRVCHALSQLQHTNGRKADTHQRRRRCHHQQNTLTIYRNFAHERAYTMNQRWHTVHTSRATNSSFHKTVRYTLYPNKYMFRYAGMQAYTHVSMIYVMYACSQSHTHT